jgi:hypothetical protein
MIEQRGEWIIGDERREKDKRDIICVEYTEMYIAQPYNEVQATTISSGEASTERIPPYAKSKLGHDWNEATESSGGFL